MEGVWEDFFQLHLFLLTEADDPGKLWLSEPRTDDFQSVQIYLSPDSSGEVRNRGTTMQPAHYWEMYVRVARFFVLLSLHNKVKLSPTRSPLLHMWYRVIWVTFPKDTRIKARTQFLSAFSRRLSRSRREQRLALFHLVNLEDDQTDRPNHRRKLAFRYALGQVAAK